MNYHTSTELSITWCKFNRFWKLRCQYINPLWLEFFPVRNLSYSHTIEEYMKNPTLYIKNIYNKINLLIKKVVVWMHKMCTKLHPRDYKIFFDKYLKDCKLKFKESINSRKWQGIQPGAVIHLCKHLNTDFWMTWLGCSSPSNILGLWSRQIAHITHMESPYILALLTLEFSLSLSLA